MEVFRNINSYFANSIEAANNNFFNSFYIRKIDKNQKFIEPDEKFFYPHKREFFEIGILQKTTKNIKIGNQTLQESENTLAIVSPFQVINYQKLPQNNDKGYIIYFNASMFTNLSQSYGLQNEFPFFKIHTIPVYQLSESNFKEIINIVEELYKEFKSDETNCFEIARSLLLILLYKVKRFTQNNKGILTMNRFEVVMAKFEALILSGNHQFLSVNEYALKMNISSIYLTECVKKVTGKSAQKIIIDYKIMYAKTLLHQLDNSVADVAYALDFNEVANFNQFFKRNTGLTATQFRKRKI